MLGMLSALLTYVALVVFLLWAPKIRKRWLLITSRILGVVAGVPLVFVLTAVLFGLLLASGNPRTQSRSVWSADGQEAKLSYDGGFLGRDYTEVR